MNKLAFLIATGFGAGLSPSMPGSFGSAVGLAFCYVSVDWPVLTRILFWLVILGLGIWSAKCFDEHFQTHDDKRIVIDEVLGMAVVTATASNQWSMLAWATALMLFRFFDIVKPGPVRKVDEWSKKQTSPWMQGFGVIADDLVAAGLALAVIIAAQSFHLIN